MDRRAFLTAGGAGLAGVAGGVLVGRGLGNGDDPPTAAVTALAEPTGSTAFRGDRQAGIDTPQQRHAVFAAFDITRRERSSTASLMASWTELASALTAAEPIDEPAVTERSECRNAADRPLL